MSQVLRRGCVVMRGEHIGVVWSVEAEHVSLVPAVFPRQQRAGDVVLDDGECRAAGIPSGWVLRASDLQLVDVDRQVRIGELAGRTVCRFVVAVSRAVVSRVDREKWEADRRHRAHASVPGAKLGKNPGRIVRAG